MSLVVSGSGEEEGFLKKRGLWLLRLNQFAPLSLANTQLLSAEQFKTLGVRKWGMKKSVLHDNKLLCHTCSPHFRHMNGLR